MKMMKRAMFGIAGLGMMITIPLSAQTVVRETSDGNLSVITFNGKPPHKRQIVTPEETARWAHYEQFVDRVRVASVANSSRGAPGKNMPAQRARIEYVNADDVSAIARFEEVDPSTSGRQWRGAPGKGRPLSR
jgi:hypothetical protein